MYKAVALVLFVSCWVLVVGSSRVTAADDGYVPPQLIRVHYDDKADVRALTDAGACVAAAGPGWVDVIVEAGPALAGTLVAQKLSAFRRVEILHENLDLMAERFRDKADLGLYHTYEEVLAELDGYVAAHPELARLEPLGTTLEGRTVLALKVSDNVASAENEPGFLICGMHHSREWISVEVVMAFAKYLIEGYATDPRVKAMVDGREIWLVPVQNPDGFVYSTTKYRMWRKNRRNNGNGTFGVDPNRNYGYEWGGAGASTSPSSDTYRGPSAASEPITQHIQNFARRHTNLKGSISFHSYGELILWPWSYTYDPCPDDAVLGDLARAMAKLNGHAPKQSSDLYPSSGDFDDYMYGVCGLASFTFELAKEFIPDEDEIRPICDKNVAALAWFVEHAADPFPLLRHEPLTATTEPGPYRLAVEFNKNHHATFALTGIDVHWAVAGGPAWTVTLNPANETTYSADVPGHGPGTYRYHFEALAQDGRRVRYPATGEFSFQVVDSLYLLVDDDGGRQYETAYLAAFHELGLPVAVHDRSKGPLSEQQLAGASAVVWSCGAESSNTLDDRDQKTLTAYLKAGGRFVLFGQDIAYNLKSTAFLRDMLRAKFVKDTAGSKRLAGAAGSCLAGLDFAIEGGDSVGQSYPEVVEPLAGAAVLARYGDDAVGALSVATDSYRLAYFGFGLEGIAGAESRRLVLQKSLAWVTGSLALNLRAASRRADVAEVSGTSALALAGAADTDALTGRLVTAIEAGRFSQVEDALAPLCHREDMRPLMRTLRRRLVDDERADAVALRRRLSEWLDR